MTSTLPTEKQKFDLYIFDLDGTLVDTRLDLANAVNFALGAIGRPMLPVDTITSFVGDGVRRLMERTLVGAAPATIERALEAFRQFYGDHVADFSKPYAGVREVLEHFQTPKCAVLTNKPQIFTQPLLEQLNLLGYFQMVVGGQPDLPLKPAPEPIWLITKELRVRPERTIIIGDSVNDVLAGRAAGIATCAALYGYRPEAELRAQAPDFTVHEPAALIELFSW